MVLPATRSWKALLLLTSMVIGAADVRAGDDIEFNRDIRPILADNCLPCHGPDGGRREGNLRLDVRESALQTRAIVPGHPDDSRLVRRIRSADPEDRMPPVDSNKQLTVPQIEIITRWISLGARYQQHWAYEPPVKPAIPAGRNAVDILVGKRQAELKLMPSPQAPRRTLIRRLSADLLGLPPTPDEVALFESDTRSDAWERLIDRWLANPHYGERMALGWLDVVRFADTIGYHSDNPRNVWPYRDWVIASFNDNKPFDQFTIEQIAGDLLPGASVQARVGSAFNRLLRSTEEGGAQPRDYEARMLTDRVRAIGAAWLGQTTGCAQCHDHKFDPLTMRDFYALGAFFADLAEPIVGHLEDGMAVPTAQDEQSLQQLEAQQQAARDRLAAAAGNPDEEQAARQLLTSIEAERKTLLDSLPRCLVSVSMPRPRTVRLLARGNWMDESGEILQPAVPHFLPQPARGPQPLTRIDLARWLVSRDNPLTARTVMNRLWKQFFGTALSRVLDDLGTQGEPPRNPELLDWLAVEFMDSGWDLKHMIKVIVSSQTYQQVSYSNPHLQRADPENREYARQSAFRLDAELIRDQTLAVSGLLSGQIGGPSTKPYQPEGYWENLNFPTRRYVADASPAQYRRGVYVWWQRTFLHPSLLAFDAPSREECCADRCRSNIPQQAMVLLNDPTYVEAARVFAARILQECRGSTAERMTWAWQRALQRNPRPQEQRAMERLLEQHRQAYTERGADATALLGVGLSPVSPDLNPSELAAWTHVARVLLNLHEFITRS